LDFAGRICRQLICESHLRTQAATRQPSIKQIEIARVSFENHLLRQMDTSLIQKGNSMTALSLGQTGERGVRKERALKPGCGALIPAKLPASKNLCSPAHSFN
jgi:hypothetical protein